MLAEMLQRLPCLPNVPGETRGALSEIGVLRIPDEVTQMEPRVWDGRKPLPSTLPTINQLTERGPFRVRDRVRDSPVDGLLVEDDVLATLAAIPGVDELLK